VCSWLSGRSLRVEMLPGRAYVCERRCRLRKGRLGPWHGGPAQDMSMHPVTLAFDDPVREQDFQTAQAKATVNVGWFVNVSTILITAWIVAHVKSA